MPRIVHARRTTAAVLGVAVFALPVQVRAADCDGNGIEDAVDVQPSGAGYRLVRKLGLSATDLALADMNADGSVDLVALSGEHVLVALGTGAWEWAEPSRAIIPPDHALLVVEDLDRDGRADVVTAGAPGMSVLFNRGNGDLEPAPGGGVPIGSSPSDMEAADVDADGWIDLVTWNLLRNVSTVRNAGGRRFEVPRNYASVIRPGSGDIMAVGDLDRDGYADLAIAAADHIGPARLAVLWNDGRGGYGETSSWTRSWIDMDLLGYADGDGDGHGDLLLSSAGVLFAFRNDGGRALTEVVLPSESIHPPALIQDLDRDGSPEITLSRGYCEGIVILSRENGSYVEFASVPIRGLQPWESGRPRAADLDGDGDQDFAVLEPGGVHVLSREPSFAREDCNANGIPDRCEADCNANGVPDACDIETGEAADCDANAIPDDCDTDCNANGISDACEVRDGTEDCNANGVPDACDFPDSNRNGVPDACEIAAGEAPDCNGNGLIDGSETIPDLLVETPARSGLATFLTRADMDSDGLPDLLVRRSGGETEIVSWDRTAGSPLFTRPIGVRPARKGSHGENVAALDVDADLDLDLALLAVNADCGPRMGMFLVENLGASRFRSVRWYRFGRAFPDSILAGDFDGDSRPDIVAWGTDWYLWLLRGIPGGLEEPRLLFLDQALEFGDVGSLDADSDGDLDLATDTGLIFRNPGDGAFVPDGTFPAGGNFIEVADFGGDGLEDIVTGGVIAENENGRMFRERILTDEVVLDGAVGDFDGDGLEDAVLALEKGLSVHLQRGGGFSESRHGLARYSIEALDVDGDGRLDLAALAPDAVVVHRNVSNPPFADLGRRIGDGFLASLEGVDLDADGDLDLAGMVGRDSGGWSLDLDLDLWMNDPPGSPRVETAFHLEGALSSPFLPRSAASDMDGDGDVDFALPTSGELILLERVAPDRLSRVGSGMAMPAAPRHVLAVDMDRDGAQDLPFVSHAGDVFVLFGGGWPGFHAVPVLTAVSFGMGISAGDLDGDGDPDLVATGIAGILPILNEGHRTFSLRTPMNPTGVPEAAVLADLDDDGDLDLAASHCGRNAVCREESLISLFRNDGLGNFAESSSRRLHRLSQDLEAADLDGDGDRDLIAAQGQTSRDDFFSAVDTVEMLLNERGELGSWALVRMGVTPGPIAIGDFDGDAVRDLAVGSQSGVILLPLRVLPPPEMDTDGDGVLDSCASVSFRRGDWNSDGRLDLTDAVALLRRLFLGGESTGCDDSGDADDNGRLDLADPIRILRHLFQGDPPPPEPHLDCGEDPTPDDDLSCVVDRTC